MMINVTKGSVIALMTAFLLLAACGEKKEQAAPQQKAQTGKAPKISAVENKFDFGKVKQGSDVVHVFKIKNQGEADLIIEKAKGS